MWTGSASAVGNQSETKVTQSSNGDAGDDPGGALLVTQGSAVINIGVAEANTGGNTATGNTSNQITNLTQTATNAPAPATFVALIPVASNSADTSNTSDGSASIITGDAAAAGNVSLTHLTQSGEGSADGVVPIPQGALVVNAGQAAANSGNNTATGNSSNATTGTVLLPITQNATIGAGLAGNTTIAGGAIASNSADIATVSDGDASITTGNAAATGNSSGTYLSQTIDPSGLVLNAQGALVLNLGDASADTGNNTATGNSSTGELIQTTQTVALNTGTPSTLVAGQATAANGLSVTNGSDGSAGIVTGNASALGNDSTTDVRQDATGSIDGLGLIVQPQAAVVANLGQAQASSGSNTATGNNSIRQFRARPVPNLPGAPIQNAAIGAGSTVVAGVVTASNQLDASLTSDGSASISTGDASATGNKSDTDLSQDAVGEVDGLGVVIQPQLGAVANVGAAQASTGNNTATGNSSRSTTQVHQFATDLQGAGSTGVAGTWTASNQFKGDVHTDGSAWIGTGDASAVGNRSETQLSQTADPSGVVINTQVAAVVNAGVAIAGSGNNVATGNSSPDLGGGIIQDASTGTGVSTNVVAGTVITSNSADYSQDADGTASISTGAAWASGNVSGTDVRQEAEGAIDGAGLVVNPQAASVVNAGLGVANTGFNNATGTNAINGVVVQQGATVANSTDADLITGIAGATNSADRDNDVKGTATIATGDAWATGNRSSTRLAQGASGTVDGLGLTVTPQLGVVANVGVATADTGQNVAIGNQSTSRVDELTQQAAILTNPSPLATGSSLVSGSAIAANTIGGANQSDGWAEIHTGDATSTGNTSTTDLTQSAHGSVDGLGATISPQVGVVVNAGVGVANTGQNRAVGNQSVSQNSTQQRALIASIDTAPVDLVVVGPVTAVNSLDAGNASDGHAKVKTGDATANGNRSATTLDQSQDSRVTGLGIVVSPQVGVVANVGLAVANTGNNQAIGNESNNLIEGLGGGNARQRARIASQTATPFSGVIVGPATAANDLEANNVSDGEACVCTGDAVASGNISSTTLLQDLELTVGTGALVVTEAGGVLNAGIGIASSGGNQATGNTSSNTAQLDQDTFINDALLGLPVVGPQTSHNGAGVTNTSAGTALVGSGNATATGNESTTDFIQAATVNADFAISNLTGGTANVGLGLANSGNNTGIGNDSTNLAVLDQTADGAGVVSNQGELSNDSDGTAVIGNPEDCLDEAPPGEETPGRPGGLPRTGGDLETQAAIGLMLLLLGFGLQRRSKPVFRS